MTTQKHLYSESDIMHTFRDVCENPVQPVIEQEDHKHPKYGQYLSYRAAMSRRPVRAPSFRDWLLMMEASDPYEDEFELNS
jgi:hypothetical protein